MKKLTSTSIVWIALIMMAGTGRTAISDLDIRFVSHKVGDVAKKSSESAVLAKERWNYEITLENKTFKDMAGLEVKYVIFYQAEHLGGTRGDEQAKRLAGSVPVELLKAHEKKVVNTDSVQLSKASLIGGYYYPSGGKQAAQDTLKGLWVRVYQNGQQVAESAVPSTLTKEKWD